MVQDLQYIIKQVYQTSTLTVQIPLVVVHRHSFYKFRLKVIFNSRLSTFNNFRFGATCIVFNICACKSHDLDEVIGFYGGVYKDACSIRNFNCKFQCKQLNTFLFCSNIHKYIQFRLAIKYICNFEKILVLATKCFTLVFVKRRECTCSFGL